MPKTPSSTVTDKHIGSRIRMLRMMINMTQEKLAGMLNITFQQIQKMESGKNRTPPSRLVEMAKIGMVPIAFFFEGLPAWKGSNQVSGTGHDLTTDFFKLPYATELATLFVAMENTANRLAVLEVARSIARASGIPALKAAE
jgi:transcriptional regulator with XRE-family HTH domain